MPVADRPAASREPWFSPPTAAALLAWVAVVTITTLPLLRATLAPPRDKVALTKAARLRVDMIGRD